MWVELEHMKQGCVCVCTVGTVSVGFYFPLYKCAPMDFSVFVSR